MQVKDIMTREVTYVGADTNLKEAAKEMEAHDIGVLPVYDKSGLKGILTDRDIIVKSTAKGDNPSAVKVRDVMTNDVEKCREDQTVEEVIGQMKARKIRRMPIVNQDNSLVGIVSLADLTLKGGKEMVSDVLEKVCQPS